MQVLKQNYDLKSFYNNENIYNKYIDITEKIIYK